MSEMSNALRRMAKTVATITQYDGPSLGKTLNFDWEKAADEIDESEAQCAAMRGALEKCAVKEALRAAHNSRFIHHRFFCKLCDAETFTGNRNDLQHTKSCSLSSDAGAKMLRVVEAAQRVSAALLHEHGAPTGVTKDLAEALAALEGK